MSQTYDIHFALTALTEAGWKPTQTDQDWLLIPVEGKQGLFFISFYFYDPDKMLSARGNIPVRILAEKEALILEFLNYANYRIPIGNLEFDVETQQLFFRVGLFFNHIELNAQLLYNVIHEVSQAVQALWPAIEAVVQMDMNLADAFKLANFK